MLQRSALLVAVCFASLSLTLAHALASCDTHPGPLAANKAVALGIFNAIANGLEARAKRTKFVIKVEDLGESWTIYESLKGGYFYREFSDKSGRKMETIRVTAGGGGIGMSIDKCTATVSDVAYQR